MPPAGARRTGGTGRGLSDNLDIAALRADTPGCGHRVHLNNAGAALMARPVVGAIKDHLDLETRIGGYEAAAQEADACAGVYASIARLIGAGAEEVALAENATVAWQLAFYAQHFGEGDRILTGRAEYAANYVAYLQMAKRTGCVVEVIADDTSGATDPAALAAMLDERVKLIALTWIPTNGGLINPAAEIGAVARQHGITFLLDACQAVGQMPVDVTALGCDILTATGRKFLRGPRGTGFLYVRRALLDHLEPPMIDHFAAPWTAPDRYRLRPDARRFETWENAYALRLGLGRAADYALDLGLDAIRARAFALADTLRGELCGLSGVRLHDLGDDKCAIVSFSHTEAEAADVAGRLRDKRINVSVSSPPSTLLDATARRLPPVVRVSPHYYNSEDEIEQLLRELRDCL